MKRAINLQHPHRIDIHCDLDPFDRFVGCLHCSNGTMQSLHTARKNQDVVAVPAFELLEWRFGWTQDLDAFGEMDL